MRLLTLAWLLSLVTIGLAGCSATETADPPEEVKSDRLLRQALSDEFAPGKEVYVDYLKIPSNTTLERHWHPGEVFVYCLEGDGKIMIDGQPPLIGRPGMVMHVPFEKMHFGVSGDAGLKLLIFRVHEENEPIRYLEGEGPKHR